MLVLIHSLVIVIYRSHRLPMLRQAPVLPPYGVTSVRLRSLHLIGAAFDFTYNISQVRLKFHGTISLIDSAYPIHRYCIPIDSFLSARCLM